MEMSSENIMQQLFKTDNPQKLFTETYSKIAAVPVNKDKLFEDCNDPLPPVNLNTRPAQQVQKKPSKSPLLQGVDQGNKNQEKLKQLFGESYYNTLLNKPMDGGGGRSIFESVAANIPSTGDYEVMEEPKPTPPASNQISLKIDGKSYSGRIVQNKKGQILFLVSESQAFVFTPSTLKNIAKK
jgi:hypothetical protein